MALLDQTRYDKLLQLAHERFDPDLSPAEEKVLRDSATSEDVPKPDKDAPRPEVRAEFLRWLATDPDAAPCIDPQGLRVFAATIPGKLDLRNCHVNPTLDFHCCNLQDEINLQSAETCGLYIFDSSLSNGIRADGAIVHGPLCLRKIVSAGTIRLLGVEITGQLNCNSAKLRAKGNALHADGAKIGGSVFLRDGFESEGTIRLLGAEITGELSCNGAKLKAKDNALYADGAKIGGGVFLIDGFESEGEIRLLDTEITGQLACNGAKLKAKGDALSADNAKIGGDVFLTDGFESEGTIRLLGAEIGGNLAFREAKVVEVACQNTVIKGDLIWQRIEKSEKTGVNLAGAKVKNLRDDKDSWPEEGMLDLDGLVYEELTLHDPSSDEDIKTGQYARELPLEAKERIAWLMLQPRDRRTEPQPWMQLRDLLERKGDHKGAKYVLFRLRRLQAEEEKQPALRWIHRKPRQSFRVAKNLCKSRKGMHHAWAFLRILIYSAAILLFWTKKSPIRILLSYWHITYAWVEENPFRICYSILFTLAVGTLVFAGAWRSGAMIETIQVQPNMIATYTESLKGTARKTDESVKPVSVHYTSFQPFIYTLENAVPLVKLGMDERWMPDLQHNPQQWFAHVGWLDGLKWLNSYGFLMWSRWLLILSGWVQATVLVAALSERFKK